MSDRVPHLARHVDKMCFVRSMRTDQFNHAPAQLAVQTGHARLGHPAIGSWVAYGLGTENQNLPGFVVLKSGQNAPDAGKPLWGAGFLPSVYQGVECRSAGEPILYLRNPDDVSREQRRAMLDVLERMNQLDLTDGRLDGRITKSAVACPKCNRTITRRHAKCMYCEQPIMHDPFA